MFLGVVISRGHGGLVQFFAFNNNIDSTYWGRGLVGGFTVVVVVVFGGATVIGLTSTGFIITVAFTTNV